MVFLAFLAGAVIAPLALALGIGLLTWLFPDPDSDSQHKKQS